MNLDSYEKQVEKLDEQIKEITKQRKLILNEAWENEVLPKMNSMVGDYFKHEEETFKCKYNSYHKVIGVHAEKRRLWVESFKSTPESPSNGSGVRFDVDCVRPNKFW